MVVNPFTSYMLEYPENSGESRGRRPEETTVNTEIVGNPHWLFGFPSSFNPKSLNTLAGMVTGELSFQRQKELQSIANSFSAEEAEKARRYNTYMADTAYQRAVKDLQKAGLNPYLAYSQGGAPMSSSSAPSGSTGGSVASDKMIETLATSAEILSLIAKLVKKK